MLSGILYIIVDIKHFNSNTKHIDYNTKYTKQNFSKSLKYIYTIISS